MKFSFYFKVLFAFLLLFGAAKAFTIYCNYRLTSLPGIGQLYTCATTEIPTSSGNRVTNVTGLHMSGRTNDDVEFISMWGDWNLTFVPQGFSNFFSNVKAIRIWDSTFDTLYGDEINEFPQLEWFEIWNSNLTTISSRLFENTPEMLFIHIDYTSLERVGHDLFTSLNVSQLQWVDFTGNRCISRWANTQATIIQLINDLRVQCPFYDEETTTTPGLTCSERQIEDLVCDLKDEMEEVRESLAVLNERIDEIESNLPTAAEEAKDEINKRAEKLQNELIQTKSELQNANEKIEALEEKLKLKDEKMEEIESRMKWLEEEIFKMSANLHA